jgi:uncharacterized Zn finger protein (UPF0148 family)
VSEAQVVHLFDQRTGEVVEADSCPMCEHNRTDRENVEREFKRALRKIRKLEQDLVSEQKVSPHRRLLEEVFALWQSACGHPNARLDFGAGSRFEAMEARYRQLEDVPLPDGSVLSRDEQMRLAVLGVAVDPDCIKGKVYDRVGLIFKSNEKTEDLCNRAVRWGNRMRAA